MLHLPYVRSNKAGTCGRSFGRTSTIKGTWAWPGPLRSHTLCESVDHSPRDWNLYSLVSTIEVERHRRTNPPIPEWLKVGYDQAWHELIELGISDLRKTDDPENVQGVLGMLALARGHLKLGAFITGLDMSELDELLEEQLAWSELYEGSGDDAAE